MSKLLYRHKQDAVLMTPLNGDNLFVLLQEPSVACGDTMLTLPTGGIETGETPKCAANRELEEESACKAGNLELIGILHPSLKYAETS